MRLVRLADIILYNQISRTLFYHGPQTNGSYVNRYMLCIVEENGAKLMKVEKKKFDDLLGKLLKAKPEPRKKIKTKGRRGSKKPLLTNG